MRFGFPELSLAMLSAHLCLPAAVWAQHLPFQHGGDLAISLVTFGPGDQIHQFFGHNALVVEDKRSNRKTLYNYGLFSFGFDMLPKYMMGRLVFWAGRAPAEPTYRQYMAGNRDVRIHELNLVPERRLAVARQLEHDVLPSNRDYLYHHYVNNCSTRVRDVIDGAIDGQLKQAGQHPARLSFRSHTRRYAQVSTWFDLLLVFWMNDHMEQAIRIWHEGFLPEELERQVLAASYLTPDGRRVALVARTETRFKSSRTSTPELPSRLWPELLVCGLSLGGIAVALERKRRRTRRRWPVRALGAHNACVGLLFGLPGLLLFLMATLTEHTVTYYNENLLLANPLTLLAVPLGIGLWVRPERSLRRLRRLWGMLALLSILGLLLKALPSFDQDNWLVVALVLPTNLGLGLAFYLGRRPAQA
ncbi:MAG: DUF4105 domain-containing protein [Proteobacteria bacterium]|nr:DUF4105 domain-containing protein [Pseudomonadota bacterium]